MRGRHGAKHPKRRPAHPRGGWGLAIAPEWTNLFNYQPRQESSTVVSETNKPPGATRADR